MSRSGGMPLMVSLALICSLGCGQHPVPKTLGNARVTKVMEAPDYYTSLSSKTILDWMVFCLRTRYDDRCLRRSEALSAYNSRGPDFEPTQTLTLLDWKLKQVDKNRGALQVKMKDDGIIYDTTVNIDTIVTFGASGIVDIEFEKIYGGDWAFSDGFAATVVVAGAALALAKGADSEGAPSSATQGSRERTLYIGSWGAWLKHSPLSGGQHREAWVRCQNGLSFEVEEHLRDSKHWFQRDAGAVLLPRKHSTLEEFIRTECGEGSGLYDHDRQ